MEVKNDRGQRIDRFQKLWEEDLQTHKIGDLLTKGQKYSRNRLIHWLAREDGIRRHYCPRKGDCFVKKLSHQKTTYISYEEVADNYEEIWE